MTVATTIDIAKICIYLVNKAIALGQEKDTQLANKIYVIMKAVQDYNDGDPTNAYLTQTSNYLYAFCGGYAFQAEGILGTTGGVVVPPSSGGGALTPFPITHIVTLAESGVSTLQDSDWIGLQDINQVIINQSILQYGTQFTFNTITGTFDFSLYNYTLQTGDVVSSFGFMPV